MLRWDDYINPLDFMPASAHDYADWLFPFLDAGGEPTHFYDYTFPDGFVIALRDVDIKPRYGANSVNILVPANITATIIGLGHDNVYYLPETKSTWRTKVAVPEHKGHVIPVYADPVFMQREDLRVGMLRDRDHRDHRIRNHR